MGDLLVTGIGQLVTNDPAVGIVEDACVVVRDGVIAWVGASGDLPEGDRSLPRLDAEGAAVVPGFVDAHTHAVFAGDRAREHGMRLAGASYADIQAAGGGIHSTVAATRAAPLHHLVLQSHARVERMLRSGTTTVEIKTGYGLDLTTETKMLDAIEA
ncbi:MAG: imidazolonepropionase, partial [Acidimicrobiia bacterium]|nr:imidazolonepropionase [Acidimicrobiia bacterium]